MLNLICEALLGTFTPLHEYLKPKPGEVLHMSLRQAQDTISYLQETH